MSTSHVVARPFNALTGLELKKIILNEIERELDADFHFRNHLAYPQVSWSWGLHVRVYPSDTPEFRVEKEEKTVRAPGSSPLAHDAPFERIALGSSRTVAAPAAGETADAARRDAGLQVPAPRVVAGPSGTKMVVDAPEIPIGGADKPAPAEVKESLAARVVSRALQASRETARSVSVRTRANPEGPSVELPAEASPPDAERSEEIERREAAKSAEEGSPTDG